MAVTVKEIFEKRNTWVIVRISRCDPGLVKVDAKRKFPIIDRKNRFSEWTSWVYANKLAIKYYGKNLKKFECYNH